MEMIGSLQVKMIAIVLGATNSLLDLELPFGYHLKRMKLKDVSIKDDILSASGRLDTKYIASNLSDDDNPEFIFISKEENMTIPAKYFVLSEMMTGNEQAYAYFDSIQSTWNHELFLIISFLHLCKEGNIEIADKYFTFIANYGCLVRRIIIDFVHYYKSNYAELSDKSFAGAKRDYVKALLVRVEYLKDNGYIE